MFSDLFLTLHPKNKEIMAKKKIQPILENVTITDVAAEGKSLVRIEDLVVFVPFVVPGDVVDLKILKKKHNYAEAVAVKFHKYSDTTTVAFYEHFRLCGLSIVQ